MARDPEDASAASPTGPPGKKPKIEEAGAEAEDPVISAARKGLQDLCAEHEVPESHGVGHALRVLEHVNKALAASTGVILQSRKQAVRLAALLHDADDRKIFKTEVSLQAANANARSIMAGAGAHTDIINEAASMIDLVSCSKNGNSVPSAALESPELLWPRWADRLEATGEIGILRCWQYNQEVGTPTVMPETPRPQTEAEVWALATNDRFERYQSSGGKSISMLDHYYDKLLRVACPPLDVVQNAYLEQEMAVRAKPLVQICLAYGRTGTIPLDEEVIGELRSRLTC
ncbi:unnamed protein product [Symbiodinium pilosum]|uniref:HD/PDEase domain-containing protein n=1 Tax=Symbiodinium pilosum TaxID=2952 RepID=A0A812W553_SYMPI|nr:unnamed protein product [Symbiodinium pilosum]